MSGSSVVVVNGETVDVADYVRLHGARIRRTLDRLAVLGARRVIEVGGHPWAMTAALVDDERFELVASVSAEEVTPWPDDIGVSVRPYTLRSPGGGEARFPNYSANVERTLFDVWEAADTVIACEVVEHLIRSPHVLFLNANRWLPRGGKLLVTTPNGAQFQNPFRRRSQSPALRYHVYSRHAHLFTLPSLAELIELAGFGILEADYWDVYPRHGLASLYGVLARVPSPYFRDKFQKTIVVAAEKRADVAALPRVPSAYDPRGEWEFIAGH